MTKNNKKLLPQTIVFVALTIAIIILAIVMILRNISSSPASEPTKGYDQATGEEIVLFTGYSPEGPMYLGIDNLREYGVLNSMIDEIKPLIEDYANQKGINLERVSFYKDAYQVIEKSIPAESIAKFALNNDELDIYVKIHTTGFEKYKFELYENTDSEPILSRNYCSALVCESTPSGVEASPIIHEDQ